MSTPRWSTRPVRFIVRVLLSVVAPAGIAVVTTGCQAQSSQPLDWNALLGTVMSGLQQSGGMPHFPLPAGGMGSSVPDDGQYVGPSPQGQCWGAGCLGRNPPNLHGVAAACDPYQVQKDNLEQTMSRATGVIRAQMQRNLARLDCQYAACLSNQGRVPAGMCR